MKTKTKKTKFPKKYVINMDCVILLPPPTALAKCPRCEKPHKRIKPLKFGKPMSFLDSTGKMTATASHWVACPKTKEPVILFDQAERQQSKAEFSIGDIFVADLKTSMAEAEDKSALAALKKEKITVKYKGGKTQAWQYQPEGEKEKSSANRRPKRRALP